jgi:hypothetical protein
VANRYRFYGRVPEPEPPSDLKSCCRRAFREGVVQGRRIGRTEGYEIGVDIGFLKCRQTKTDEDSAREPAPVGDQP